MMRVILFCLTVATICKADADGRSEHIRESTFIFENLKNFPLGSPLSKLEGLGKKNWLKKSLVQPIYVQSGSWKVRLETGYSIFRIFPYVKKGSPPLPQYMSLIIRVKGFLSVADFLAECDKVNTKFVVDEFSAYGAGFDIYKGAEPQEKVVEKGAKGSLRDAPKKGTQIGDRPPKVMYDNEK